MKLLSRGNPQIAKGDGDAPVQGYIAAMQGWKRDLGKRLDALIMRYMPSVRKAVKWNSPFFTASRARVGSCRSMSLQHVSLTMILEVYYRHMPLYGKQAAEDDFPLN